MKFAPLSKTSSKVCKFYNGLFSLFIHCLEETRSITEPAGALALAGLKRYVIQNNLIGAQKKFVAVVSGANMNFDRLRFVAERAELGEGREALLSVDIPERPGRHVLFFLMCLSANMFPKVSLPYTPSFIHVRLLNSSTDIISLRIGLMSYCRSNYSRLHARLKFTKYWRNSQASICKVSISVTMKWLKVMLDT